MADDSGGESRSATGGVAPLKPASSCTFRGLGALLRTPDAVGPPDPVRYPVRLGATAAPASAREATHLNAVKEVFERGEAAQPADAPA